MVIGYDVPFLIDNENRNRRPGRLAGVTHQGTLMLTTPGLTVWYNWLKKSDETILLVLSKAPHC
jgi:hypothetical protein